MNNLPKTGGRAFGGGNQFPCDEARESTSKLKPIYYLGKFEQNF